MLFVNCIDLHVAVLLHTFLLPLRLELKSKAQGLTQGKRSRFFMKIREIHVRFLGNNHGNSGGKNQKFCLNPKLLKSNFEGPKCKLRHQCHTFAKKGAFFLNMSISVLDLGV